MKQKITFFILGLLTGLILGAAGMAIVKQTKQPVTTATTLEGTVICLPHKDTSVPQTLECASGLKTSDKTYSLSSEKPLTEVSAAAGSDKKIKVTGILQAENASSKYQTDGSFVVSSYEFLP